MYLANENGFVDRMHNTMSMIEAGNNLNKMTVFMVSQTIFEYY